MNPQLILVVLAVWRNSRLLVGTDACSLLPGGLPKCFPNAVDYTSTENLKEIKYRLQNKHQILGYDFNEGKHILRLGQRWERQVGGKADLVTCEADFTQDAYKDTYLTKLFDYTKHDGSSDPKDVIGEKPVTSYFVLTKKEVWKCSSLPKSDGTKIEFIRVVTELASKDLQGSILFFDGIDVTSVPMPENDQFRGSRNFISIVREVKYLDPANPSNNLKYDGDLNFVQSEDIEDNLSSFTPVARVREKFSEGGFFKEKKSETNELWSISFPNRKGPHLLEKRKPVQEVETFDDKYICDQKSEDARLYSASNLPAFSQYLGVEQPIRSYASYTKMEPNQFLSNFIVTNHEIWTCHSTESTADAKQPVNSNVRTFERSVTEYIGKTPIRSLYYFHPENKIWKFDLDSAAKTTVAFKTISYSSQEQPENRLKFYGLLKLNRKEVRREKPLQKTAMRLNLQKPKVEEKEAVVESEKKLCCEKSEPSTRCNSEKQTEVGGKMVDGDGEMEEYYQLPYDENDVTTILKTFRL